MNFVEIYERECFNKKLTFINKTLINLRKIIESIVDLLQKSIKCHRFWKKKIRKFFCFD